MQVRGGTQQYHRFTFHDTFAGIGAGILGLEGSGGRCVGAFEQYRRARKVYESHSSVRVQGEMRQVHAKDWPAAVLYLSGRRKGVAADEREEVARHQIGNSMPVEMVHAIGVEVGRYLAAVGEGEVNVSKRQAPTEGDKGVDSAEVERARASVVTVLRSEEARGMGSTRTLGLLWWNWA
jgi:hypothetical protein